MQEQIFEMLFDKDDVTWQTMLYELVRTEKMDPWDIDISLISQRFFEMIHKMKEMDFRIGGKILLAAAVLLKIKSNQLLGKDLDAFDRMFQTEDELLLDESSGEKPSYEHLKNIQLIPRTPQERKRKVSIYDLVDALQKAIEVKRRRVMRDIPAGALEIPEKQIDISEVIKSIYGRIKSFFAVNDSKKLNFSALIPSESRHDKVYTFIPLLHLSTQRKIDLIQDQHFGEIQIAMLSASAEKQVAEEIENPA
jgi:segregation and condensation protein A